ncbi:MAG TPA: GNAT family N-acetyltransferase [Tepidisphaeraceae bacterium]|jgi:predicted dehydrogenase/GNAT superfamily N-acetyltransferase|nr:GNAT family N-acetyltransferase [Tepidisphaeraceae bacterium]
MEQLRIGIVGAAGRGASFKAALDASGEAVLHAVCDARADALPKAQATLGAREAYVDFDEMIDRADLHAVVIATPMPLHVPQSIRALSAGLHVLSEVPAGVSIDECRALTVAARRSRAAYMMAENYTYIRTNAIVREMVARGLFGDTYFAEAEYVHEIRKYETFTPWRRHWQLGLPGNTYCTHSLGPVLQWMPGHRVTQVACAGSGQRHIDSTGKPFEGTNNLTLCRTDKGGLIKLRLDLLSDRPHAMTNYQLQGADGCYESARAPGEPDRVWLRARSTDANAWTPLADLADEFLPDYWKHASEQAKAAGHGGGDYFEVMDFLAACRGTRPAPIGIDAAMDMTLPGLASQQSAAQGGAWVDVPDSRQWTADYVHRDGQLNMIFPDRAATPPADVPPGYALRPFDAARDVPAYAALMNKAGFGDWPPDRVLSTSRNALDSGHLVIEHLETRALVATALANHSPSALHPNGGELGWVAADPAHAGRGLGRAACAAVVALLRTRGYRRLFLLTDDFRLPAIAIYLRLGFEPLLHNNAMPIRWDAVRTALRR